ncbi:MAG: VOC family protein [Pyrinomonadaceae bacterium]|nr:VOC family protein [Pyrinomonadaceae bacterium]
MNREVWLNLPVKDVARSRQFFTKLGFEFQSGPGETPQMTALRFGKNVIMLVEEEQFKFYSKNPISDPSAGTEILVSFSADSREDVEDLAEKVRAAGGVIFSEPGDVMDWMYGFAFVDLDGHRWNALFMPSSDEKTEPANS